jgi:hypothetical protein
MKEIRKRCAPNEIITLCNSCHATLHHLLQDGKSPADPKDFIIINSRSRIVCSQENP